MKLANAERETENRLAAVLRQVFSVRLPGYSKEESGLLHTVLRDDRGNIYYSDEINHAVVSLDEKGMLRWRRGGKGNKPEEFQYPRGIALGRTLHDGVLQQSLCVCDAWNNRVQVLDPDGSYRGSWRDAGDLSFNDVSDIRYMEESPRGGEVYWLVLDRGNHRLCALAPDGRLLFQIGHAYSPSLETQWLKGCLEPPIDPAPDGIVHDYYAFDPLYYPTRILGKTEAALFIYEPNPGRLKQLFLGNLFPLTIHPPHAAEWVASDGSLLLAWSPPARRLIWFDAAGNPLLEAPVDGRPVTSDGWPGEVWVQAGDQLRLLRLDRPDPHLASSQEIEPYPALLRSALDELASLPENSEQSLFGDLLAVSNDFLDACEELLVRAKELHAEISPLEKTRERAVLILGKLGEVRIRTNKAVHPLFLAGLKLRLLGQCFPGAAIGTAGECAGAAFGRHTQPVASALVHAVRSLEETSRQRLRLWELPAGVSEALGSMLADQCNDLVLLISELQRWSGTVFFTTDFLILPPAARNRVGATAEGEPGCWIRRPVARPAKASSRCLSELDRIPLMAAHGACSSNPSCIARGSNGDFFVGFYDSGSLLHLDIAGRILREVFGPASPRGPLSGPLGIAVDEKGRLWIAEFLAHRIRIFDPVTEEQKTIRESSAGAAALSLPVGICIGPADSMAVADSGNDRIAAITEAGAIRTLVGKSGTRPGEFRHPLSLCVDAANPGSAFWVVDEGNHRLQKFDELGLCLGQIGRCGSGPGCFIFPQQVAQFPDGMLIVSQFRLDRSLKLLSPRGEELDRLFLDYAPGGILVNEGLLLVTELNGQHIRVYKRT